MNYNKIAQLLDTAAVDAEAIEQISKTKPIDLDQAYAIQGLSIAMRYKRLENFVGVKLGFTSKAKMAQMGVDDLIWGRLTDRMQYFESEELNMDAFIHPRAEPEVAFRMARALDRPLERNDLTNYVDAVCIAIEIIDSRFEDFKFSLEDVVADNCSSSGFILGKWLPMDVNFSNTEITLSIDGAPVQQGNTNAILGDPVNSILEASRLLVDHGESLGKGDIILAGAATAAEYISSGSMIKAESPDLGEVTLRTA